MVKGRRLWGLALLCLLSGNGWLLRQAWPSKLDWSLAASIHFALIGIVGLLVMVVRREFGLWPGRRLLALCGLGLCLFVVPMAALEGTQGHISEAMTAALFCGVPLLTVLAGSALGIGPLRAGGLMVPALMGLAGAALLFPVGDPGSLRRWLSLAIVAGACFVVALASVQMHRTIQEISIAAAATAVGLASAVTLGLGAGTLGWHGIAARVAAAEALRGAVLDLPEVWLLVWLIREVEPSRLSARFLLVPLVTVLEGYAVERAGFGWRATLALGLLCLGGVMLLRQEEPEEIPGLHLR